MIGAYSKGLLSNPVLPILLKQTLVRPASGVRLQAVVGWGCKSNTKKIADYAKKNHLPLLRLEDGFLRSYGTGVSYAQLSLIVDDVGIYYDSTQPSSLENMLVSDKDLLLGIVDQVEYAKALILQHTLSKYNHAPLLPQGLIRHDDKKRVLVVDQTYGDVSIALGAASGQTFLDMLYAARIENPEATIYIKTHPEVSSGAKKGYLSDIKEDGRTVILRGLVNPLSLIEQMDRVYVVSSTMGFEALLLGKSVSVFGMPWYAGWGQTDDRQICSRRTRKRTVNELFAAAYFHYTRYLNPVTYLSGTIFDVINWLVLQKKMVRRYPGRKICIGFRRWKAYNLTPILSLDDARVVFVKNAKEAEKLMPSSCDSLVFWGNKAPDAVCELSRVSGARMLHMEDGFFRSIGLGSDLIAPLSLVLDETGIYFDPTKSSDLEVLLNNQIFTAQDCERAENVRAFIVQNGLTKYNTEKRLRPDWQTNGKTVILVPGQVEDDASIYYGCIQVKTNLGLLEEARKQHPNAYIVYKPHPDVMSGNRKGHVQLAQASLFADHIETECSVVSCIDVVDIVYTMTSLSGFEALLRNKQVVVYGRPFYAGWGLTTDMMADDTNFNRRKRRLSLSELVAGALLYYPIYHDRLLNGYTSCEAVLHQLLEYRTRLEKNNQLQLLRSGYLRRQIRKADILLRAWLT